MSLKTKLLWQVIKYGLIGVLATVIQVAIFYALASTIWPCLLPNDWAVEHLGLSAVHASWDGFKMVASDSTRAWYFAYCTVVGFLVSNIFCWLMNRKFVFEPGKFAWWKELVMFVVVSAVAMVLATALSAFLISRQGIMTSLAVLIEVIVSFLINFVLRKFVIFKG